MAGQAAARAREMAVRVSLGAGRGRLIRLVMAESAMVGLAAAGLGILFAWWATPFVVRQIATTDNPIRLALGPDWMVMAFGVVLTVVVMLLFGLVPAMRASRVKPASALKGGEEPRGGMKWMQGMIATQVAFCFVVLFAAGLFVSSFARLAVKPLGFSPERIVTIDVLAQEFEPQATWDQRLEQLRAMPGVERVSMASDALLSGSFTTTFIAVNGEPPSRVPTYEIHISPGWLETMKVSLLAGRDLTASDTSPGAAVVNEEFARQYFSGANPLGRRFEKALHGGPGPYSFEIVGLVGNAAYSDLHEPDPPTAYLPLRGLVKNGETAKLQGGTFVVRTKGNPAAMVQTLRHAVMQMSHGIHIFDVTTEAELVRGQMIRERLLATLAGFFGMMALLLAAIGLYGVLHYSVVQREREIGIRIALGAAAANIARIVTMRVMVMVLVGAVAGLVLGLGSQRFVATLLYGVKATDFSVMLLPAGVLLGAVLLAALTPVLRAVRIDPAVMLRAE